MPILCLYITPRLFWEIESLGPWQVIKSRRFHVIFQFFFNSATKSWVTRAILSRASKSWVTRARVANFFSFFAHCSDNSFSSLVYVIGVPKSPARHHHLVNEDPPNRIKKK